MRRIWRASYLLLHGLSTASYWTVRGVAFGIETMKTPDDIHVAEKDCRFADCGLSVDAVLHGFSIDYDGHKLNSIIMDKLQRIEHLSSDQIVLDGVIRRTDNMIQGCHAKHTEAPFASFVLAFEKKIDLIVNRLQRMLELQDITIRRGLDWLTYRDMVIVQVAAMTVDEQSSKRGGYTIQSLLERIGQSSLIAELDKVLDRVIAKDAQQQGVSVRIALKIVRDKFLCHYDNHENYDLFGREKESFWSNCFFHLLLATRIQ